MLQIKFIEFHNVGIVRDVTIEPGKCMIIHGENAQGKTTIQNTILEVLGVKTNAKLLKDGEEKGLAAIWFDDEAETRVDLNLTEKGQKRTVISKGKRQNISFIDDINDALKVNPVDFLNAKAKGARKELLMKVVNFKLNPSQMQRLDIKPEDLEKVDNHLDILDELYDKIFADRTTINSYAKKNEGAIAAIGPVVVEEKPEDIKASINELELKEEAVRQSYTERYDGIGKELRDIQKVNEGVIKQRQEEVTRIYNEKLAELNNWKSKEVSIITNDEKILEKESNDSFNKAKSELDTERNNETSHISIELTKLRAKLEQAQNSANLKKQRDDYRKELATYEQQSKDYTAHLELIKTIKSEMLDNIPLKGVEVRGDDVWVDGRTWENTNHARRLEVCIEQALLRDGGTIVSDNLESLDSKNLELFKEMVKSRGIQLIGARVADCPLTIETEKGKVLL